MGDVLFRRTGVVARERAIGRIFKTIRPGAPDGDARIVHTVLIAFHIVHAKVGVGAKAPYKPGQ